jgi:uncharacterized protein YceK
MKKLTLLLIGMIFLGGCSSSVLVEDFQADYEKQQSIYDIEYRRKRRYP